MSKLPTDVTDGRLRRQSQAFKLGLTFHISFFVDKRATNSSAYENFPFGTPFVLSPPPNCRVRLTYLGLVTTSNFSQNVEIQRNRYIGHGILHDCQFLSGDYFVDRSEDFHAVESIRVHRYCLHPPTSVLTDKKLPT